MLHVLINEIFGILDDSRKRQTARTNFSVEFYGTTWEQKRETCAFTKRCACCKITRRVCVYSFFMAFDCYFIVFALNGAERAFILAISIALMFVFCVLIVFIIG